MQIEILPIPMRSPSVPQRSWPQMRGRRSRPADSFNVAFSGGHAPWIMLRDLANEDVPWDKVQVFQIDERVAPAGDPDRNLTHLRESLLAARAAAPRPDSCHAG